MLRVGASNTRDDRVTFPRRAWPADTSGQPVEKEGKRIQAIGADEVTPTFPDISFVGCLKKKQFIR